MAEFDAARIETPRAIKVFGERYMGVPRMLGIADDGGAAATIVDT